jgi:hypothetical protein
MKSWMRAARAAASISALRGAVAAVGDVVADGVVEEDGVLGDDADAGVERVLRDVAEVLAVDADGAAGHVVEAEEEAPMVLLPAPGRAHHGDAAGRGGRGTTGP